MIHRLRVHNFKSIRDVSVELGPVVVLIGRSGTGKSNFAGSLGFVRDYLITRGETLQQYHRSLEELFPAFGQNDFMSSNSNLEFQALTRSSITRFDSGFLRRDNLTGDFRCLKP